MTTPFPFLDRDDLSVLDVLIAAEEHDIVLFRNGDDLGLGLKSRAAYDAGIPNWLANGIRKHKAELVSMLRSLNPSEHGFMPG